MKVKFKRSYSISIIVAYTFLLSVLVIGIIGPLFTSTAPWKIELNGEIRYPAMRYYFHDLGFGNLPLGWSTMEWKALQGKKQENLIPFDANYIDLGTVGGVAPLNDPKHILGTDLLGRDVLAGMISGAFVSLKIAFFSVFLALIFAFIISTMTTYYGNRRLKMNGLQSMFFSFLLIFCYYYTFIAFSPIEVSLLIKVFQFIFFFGFCTLSLSISKNVFNFKRLKKHYIPLDSIGLKIYEIFQSIPKLILLLLLVGLSSKNNITLLILIISLLLWPIFYRYIRIEFLREKSKDSFQVLQNLGYPDRRIILYHFIPKSISAISTTLIFAIGSIILLEATLSFLGIGLPNDVITWGKILVQARIRIDAWWLGLFPGILIFLVLYSIGVISNKTRSE